MLPFKVLACAAFLSIASSSALAFRTPEASFPSSPFVLFVYTYKSIYSVDIAAFLCYNSYVLIKKGLPMTQKEIAEALGVSQSTVSLALAGSEKISEPLKGQIVELASAKGYHPNLNARALQARKSGLVGVVFPDFSQAYYNELKKDIHPLLKERGYTGLFFTAGDDGAAGQLIGELQGRGVEGIIAGPGSFKHLKELCLSNFPVVFYRKPEAPLPCCSVDVDRYDGGYLAGRHLLSLGYEDFACLGCDPASPDGRFQGFLAALAEAGVSFNSKAAIRCQPGMEGGCEGFAAYLKGSKPPRAVFAFNDSTAIGGMRAACDAGLGIPEDVAFVGFDDIKEASFSIPSLTTVAQPRQETAANLVRLLFDRIDGEGLSLRHILLKASLTVRESCGAKLKR